MYLIVTSKTFKAPEFEIHDRDSREVYFEISRTLYPGRKLIQYDYEHMLGYTAAEDILFSTNPYLQLLKEALRHPVYFLKRILKTWKIVILFPESITLPITFCNAEKQNWKSWISRQSVLNGVSPENLEISLELDYLRNPQKYDLMVRSVEDLNTQEYSMYTEKAFQISHLSASPPARLNFQNHNHVQVVAGKIVVSDASILPVSNYRTEVSVHLAGYLKPIPNSDSYKIIKTSTRTNSIDKAIFIGSSISWFHFLVECLPRLMAIPECRRNKLSLVLPSDTPNSIIQICTILTQAEVITLALTESVDVDDLILGIEIGVSDPLAFDFRKGLIQEAVSHLRGRLEWELEKRRELPDKIFLKRPSGLFRPLQNEKKVIKFLKRNGFSIISPETLELKEVINYFSAARLIVAESGAAITNVIFSSPGAHLIELYPGKGPLTFWPELASISGVTVTKVMSKPFPLGPKGLARDGIRIPIKELRTAVSSCIKEIESTRI